MKINNYFKDDFKNSIQNASSTEEVYRLISPVIDILLNTVDDNERNKAALLLADYVPEFAVDTIFKVLLDPKTKNNRSTLLYALENLDCSAYCSDLIDILFNSRYEARVGAYKLIEKMVIDGVTVNVSKEQVNLLKNKLNDIRVQFDFYLAVLELLL